MVCVSPLYNVLTKVLPGENLVLSYLTSTKISEFPSIEKAVSDAIANLGTCTVGIFEFWDATAQLLRWEA